MFSSLDEKILKEFVKEILDEWKETNSILRDVRDSLKVIAKEVKPEPLPDVSQKLILGKPEPQ